MSVYRLKQKQASNFNKIDLNNISDISWLVLLVEEIRVHG